MDDVVSSGVRNEDEGLYPIQHGYWLQTMQAAIAKRSGGSAATPRS
jgi:benzoate/toluate 1,2-dioxygenase alpha subunit